MILTADFHIHSPFSMAASKNTTPAMLTAACRIKGLDILGSGDAFQPKWRKAWTDFGENADNADGVTVLPTSEVDGKGKVHHLILMTDFSQAEEIADRLRPYSSNIDKGGRPNVSLSGEAILKIVHDCGAYCGPAHAFTPWTGMYGRVESLRDCYGDEKPDFLELGLSADTSYGENIPELGGLPFLSNSDAHSAQLHKLGREFNKIDTDSRKPQDIINAVLENRIVLNAGLFPEEGKYNRTACTKCYRQFSVAEAEECGGKCECGGKIKIGVRDRALSKSAQKSFDGKILSRPPYLHIIPLAEIVTGVLKAASPNTKQCKTLYSALVSEFGTEIAVLTEVPTERIAEINAPVADAVKKFREGKIILHPGGGGKYGTFEI